jgi:hypothetical protein
VASVAARIAQECSPASYLCNLNSELSKRVGVEGSTCGRPAGAQRRCRHGRPSKHAEGTPRSAERLHANTPRILLNQPTNHLSLFSSSHEPFSTKICHESIRGTERATPRARMAAAIVTEEFNLSELQKELAAVEVVPCNDFGVL